MPQGFEWIISCRIAERISKAFKPMMPDEVDNYSKEWLQRISFYFRVIDELAEEKAERDKRKQNMR
jgi:hypothetical protein